jgi:hypothetical protein
MAERTDHLGRWHIVGVVLLGLSYLACGVLGGRGLLHWFTEPSPYFFVALISAVALTLIVRPWRR